MMNRRTLLAATAAVAATPALPAFARRTAPSGFVRREGTQFTLDGKPYRYVGANLW